MKVIRVTEVDFTAMWERLRTTAEWRHPFLSASDIAYSKEYAQDSHFEDVSCVIAEDQTPILGARMAIRTYADGHRELSGFGRPIEYLESPTAAPAQRDGAAGVLREQLQALLQREAFAVVLFRELQPVLSPIGRCLLDAGARATPRFTQVIDLSLPEVLLRLQVRKSYKSLINWGEKNIHLTLRDHASVTNDDMEEFRRLHIEAAGRETRSHRTWELQLDMVRQKEAFLLLGRLDGALVTAAFFVHSPQYCYYGVSAAKRELFEKPLAHVVMWRAILHAKAIGCRWFEVGDQLFPAQTAPPPTPKDLGISTFKKGFGGDTHIRTDIVWKQPPANDQQTTTPVTNPHEQ